MVSGSLHSPSGLGHDHSAGVDPARDAAQLCSGTTTRLVEGVLDGAGAVLMGMRPRNASAADTAASPLLPEPAPLVKSLFYSASASVLAVLRSQHTEPRLALNSDFQLRIGVADLCRSTSPPGGGWGEAAAWEEYAADAGELRWRDAATADTPAMLLPRGRGGGIMRGGRLSGMLRLATFGIRPLQVGMSRHPITGIEEVEELLAVGGTPADDVVARVYVAEVDDLVTPADDDEDNHAAHSQPAATGFVTARIRTRLLVCVAFSRAEDLTSTLLRMEAHKHLTTSDPSSSSSSDDEDDVASVGAAVRPSDALNARGWPCQPSWGALAAFLAHADEEVVLLELPPAAHDPVMAAVSVEEAALARAAAQSARTRKWCRPAHVQRRQCWQPTLRHHAT